MDKWGLGQWAVLTVSFTGWSALCVSFGVWLERIKSENRQEPTSGETASSRRYISDSREMATMAD